MGLREVWVVLRNAWWLPLMGLIAGGGTALAVSLVQTPLYSSSTQLFVSTPAVASPADVYQGGEYSLQRVTSYAELLRGQALAVRVVDRLGLSTSPKELADRVTVSAPTDSVLLNVTVTDPSPRQAQRIADALGREFTVMAAQLEAPSADAASPVKVTITEPPRLPVSPSSPDVVRRVGFGLLVGLILGASAAIARARLDRSVRDPEEVADLTGAPVIGVVMQDEALVGEHRVDLTKDSRAAENYRQLRTNLQSLAPAKVFLVSSALPEEGATTLTINLGRTLAEMGKRVTVVEADLRRPKLMRYLGLTGTSGLTDVLLGKAGLADVARTDGEELTIIPAGQRPPNLGELLASSRMRAVIDELRAESDFVLIQGPALLPVADSSSLAVHCDGVLFSIRYGSTRKDQLQRAVATLQRVGVRTIGVVLNVVPAKAELASSYGYDTSYGDEAAGNGVARWAAPTSHRHSAV